MAATFEFQEDNGPATGSPAKGTTRTGNRTERNYKAIDDSTTPYSDAAAIIVAGLNSMTKYQFGRFTGTFNQILNGLWSLHTAPSGALATGLTLKGKVQSTYATPARVTDSGMSSPIDFTTAVAIGAGQTVLFSTVGPEDASPSSGIVAAGYSQYLVGQLQTSTAAAAGDIATITETLQYDEN
jgi:hypothetical protein